MLWLAVGMVVAVIIVLAIYVFLKSRKGEGPNWDSLGV
jgi:hypothetical protein